jgi:hypothetical protein
MKATVKKIVIPATTKIQSITLELTEREAEIIGNLLGNISPEVFRQVVNKSLVIGGKLREPVTRIEIYNLGAYKALDDALKTD